MPMQRHVVPKERGWAVRKESSARASSTHATQADAIKRAKEIVRKAGGGEVIVHGRDGRVHDKDTVFGRDPAPPGDRR